MIGSGLWVDDAFASIHIAAVVELILVVSVLHVVVVVVVDPPDKASSKIWASSFPASQAGASKDGGDCKQRGDRYRYEDLRRNNISKSCQYERGPKCY